tara:strand:+ start:11370 stop:11615 length:246 start_codon:yes stop_codon:yes gene_type:complete
MIPEHGFFIITKENCSYCTKAIELFENNMINYGSFKKEDLDDNEIEKIREDGIKTYPIIYNDGKLFKRGYEELKEYCDLLM